MCIRDSAGCQSSACHPLQAHLVLETASSFRLILYWKRLGPAQAAVDAYISCDDNCPLPSLRGSAKEILQCRKLGVPTLRLPITSVNTRSKVSTEFPSLWRSSKPSCLRSSPSLPPGADTKRRFGPVISQNCMA